MSPVRPSCPASPGSSLDGDSRFHWITGLPGQGQRAGEHPAPAGEQEGARWGSLQHRAGLRPSEGPLQPLPAGLPQTKSATHGKGRAFCLPSTPSPQSSPDQSVSLPYFTGGRRQGDQTCPLIPLSPGQTHSRLVPVPHTAPALPTGRQAGRTGQGRAGPRATSSSRSRVPAIPEQR